MDFRGPASAGYNVGVLAWADMALGHQSWSGTPGCAPEGRPSSAGAGADGAGPHGSLAAAAGPQDGIRGTSVVARRQTSLSRDTEIDAHRRSIRKSDIELMSVRTWSSCFTAHHSPPPDYLFRHSIAAVQNRVPTSIVTFERSPHAGLRSVIGGRRLALKSAPDCVRPRGAIHSRGRDERRDLHRAQIRIWDYWQMWHSGNTMAGG